MNDDYVQLKARYERLKLLYQVGSVIHSTLEPQGALSLIVREATRLMQASSCSVVLVNPTNGFLEIQASQGLPENAESLKLRLGEGLTGWVAQTGKPARVGDVTKDKRYIMLRPEVRSELAVPLMTRNCWNRSPPRPRASFKTPGFTNRSGSRRACSNPSPGSATPSTPR
jgi:GAF domain-containing protein